MRVLVVGGTGWLGGEVVRCAVARGHEVATLSRGVSGGPPPGVGALTADRDDPDAVGQALAGVRPDVVVDTSGYTVAGARSMAVHLADVGAYAYVSSLNAYRDWPASPIRGTDDPLWGDDDDLAEYGPMKAASERVLSRALDGWLVDAAENGRSGAVNATGDVGMTTYGRLLEVCREAVGDDALAPVTWTERDDTALLAAGVERWTHLPFWVPADEARSLWSIDTRSAREARLPSRPVEQTVRDLWAWVREQPEDPAVPAGRGRPGLPDDVERRLLG